MAGKVHWGHEGQILCPSFAFKDIRGQVDCRDLSPCPTPLSPYPTVLPFLRNKITLKSPLKLGLVIIPGMNTFDNDTNIIRIARNKEVFHKKGEEKCSLYSDDGFAEE